MKHTTRILITVGLLVLLSACAPQQTSLPSDELLGLGEQYLLELDYEQALAHFLKVIELEPMNPRGYTGAAEAYRELGDLDSAVAVLEQGVTATGNADLASALEVTRRRAEAMKRRQEHQDLLMQMYEFFEGGRMEDALALFAALGEEMQYFDQEVPTLYLSSEGRGVGVYCFEDYGSAYALYYGGYEGDQRSGQGFWSIAPDFNYRLDGRWDNDLPNGPAELVHSIQDPEVSFWEIRYSGTLVDGVWDGELQYRYCKEDTVNVTPMYFDNGYIRIWDVVLEDDGQESLIISHSGYVEDSDGNLLHEVEQTSWHEETDVQYGIVGIAGTGTTF